MRNTKSKSKNANLLIDKYKSLLTPGFSAPISKWTYDITKSYDWNYEYGPKFTGVFPVRDIKPTKSFLHFKLNSLFGVPAGPLLNSQWIELYSKLGFDILTYKTLRTRSYPAFSMPHMLYVESKKEANKYFGRPFMNRYESLAMTNSFGVPSKDPDVWQEDLKKAINVLKEGQLLIASVMGTREAAKNEEEFVNDHAVCAKLALEAGAQVIEVNLSCPNLHGTGIICYDVKLVERICFQVKNAIGNIPLIAKIGYYSDQIVLKDFVKKTSKYLDGIAAINTIRGDIEDVQMKKPHMRHIESSGVCGQMIRPYGLNMVEQLVKIRKEDNLKLAIIGVGGVTVPDDYDKYISIGADAVQSATGAMMDPLLAYKIYNKELKKRQDYPSLRKLGFSNFQKVIANNQLSNLKNLYLEMIYSKNSYGERNTLQLSSKQFRLKHGERGRKTSSIYLNHRLSLLNDPIDRKLLATLLDQIIHERVLTDGSSKYGVISVSSSSSPELTALMLDLFPESIDRAVILPEHVLNSEYGSHTSIYGHLDDSIPWVLIDDVFTSGKTFENALVKIKKILGKKFDNLKIHGVSLTHRNQENIEIFIKKTSKSVHTLVSLNDLLMHHWKNFSSTQKKLIKKERIELT
jgi:dihydroorotate dehydrogenase/orotate phosphoribosyltransferase